MRLKLTTYIWVFLTWFIMKIFGIFLLNFLWLRNTIITVKFDTIPIEAMVIWITSMLNALESSSAILLDIDVVLFSSIATVLLCKISVKFVTLSIVARSICTVCTRMIRCATLLRVAYKCATPSFRTGNARQVLYCTLLK